MGKKYGMAVLIVETGEIFDTMTECAEYLGVTVGMVSMCISGRVSSCKGYHIELIDCVVHHGLTDDILDELYFLTGDDCEWREHPTRDNVYVSETGIIAKYQNGGVVIKRQHRQNSGYLIVSVGDLGSITSSNHNVLVHRLVAETFIHNDSPDIKTFVNHLDGNKNNNAAWNLEWCTRSRNMRHAFDNGIYKTQKVMVVETGEVFSSATECARKIGGSVSGLHDCKSGRQKQHRGYHFKFLGGDDRE